MPHRPTISVPQPCAQNWAAMTPTGAGRHCAACATEVVDFTRLSEAEVLAYLAVRPGQRVCGLLATRAGSPGPPARRWPRWVLALVALVGGQRLAVATGLPPRPLVTADSSRGRVAPGVPITIRGVVLDQRSGRPVQRVFVFVGDTPYGAVTNERGEFVLSFGSDWAPARAGGIQLNLRADFLLAGTLSVTVNLADPAHLKPLRIRVLARPYEGFALGKILVRKPPVAPPAPDSSGK